MPELKADKEMEILNKNFNLMIDRLKSQQKNYLLLKDMKHGKMLRENLLTKLSPLTPIQLTVDNIKSKYLKNIELDNQDKFKTNFKQYKNKLNKLKI